MPKMSRPVAVDASPEQVDQIAASIREWGWTNPVLVGENNTLIAGHGRALAARKLRITEVPVMIAAGWTEAQKKAYALADNKLALNAGWDEALLGLEIGELEGLGFDIGLLGFTDTQIKALGSKANAGLPDPDGVPKVPTESVARLPASPANDALWRPYSGTSRTQA